MMNVSQTDFSAMMLYKKTGLTPFVSRVAATASLASLSLLIGCAGINANNAKKDDLAGTSAVTAAWVELAGDNQAIVRANTTQNQCPMMLLDGVSHPMQLRVGAATVPQRPTMSDASDSKASVFSTTTCEAVLPADVTKVRVGNVNLPVPKPAPQRIVILGDTGCRLKKTDKIYQDCRDEAAWPFPVVAATAARLKPDLVIHVGDYHYRETACPSDVPGCQGSPWGYGSDAWEADFLLPAAPLLKAAPWIFLRGNHEECTRAGQGWFRYLDPHPFDTARSCDDPRNDANANYTEPYAVNLGAQTQLIVFDSAKIQKKPLSPDNAQYIKYLAQFKTVASLAKKPGTRSLFASHHPVFGFVLDGDNRPISVGIGLQSVMKDLYPESYYPPEIQIAFHGHVHNFQALNFSTQHAATFVSGNGGDVTDPNFPTPFPQNASTAPGTELESFAHTNAFGFMMMERSGDDWTYQVYTRHAEKIATCTVPSPGKIHCDKSGYIGH